MKYIQEILHGSKYSVAEFQEGNVSNAEILIWVPTEGCTSSPFCCSQKMTGVGIWEKARQHGKGKDRSKPFY